MTMKRWMVFVQLAEEIEVFADTQDQAEKLALEMFDPLALEAYVTESFEFTEENQ